MSNIIAIVGRPNVGKSTFFNRMIKRREAIVDPTSGVTRDRHYSKCDWNGKTFTLIDTGDNTQTGGRLKRVRDYIKDEKDFCFTYGDGLSDVDILSTIKFHREHGKLATVTGVRPPGRYGALEIRDKQVTSFTEKPSGDGDLINGGFFVLSPNCLDLIDGDNTNWEQESISKLVKI